MADRSSGGSGLGSTSGTAGADRQPGARVSTLELFFDLVFVFTITQLALIVEHHPSWSSAAQALLELLVIYWIYSGYSWLTNSVGSATARQRMILLLGMAAFLIVSLAVPRAFDRDGIAFGYAYLLLTVVHLIGFLIGGVESAALAMRRVGAANLAACAFVVAAGYAGAPAHWWLWSAAVVVQWTQPLVTRTTQGFAIDVDHFAERHGLMIIIVLGESLVSVSVAANDLPVGIDLVAGVLCGLAASAALWWSYFGGDDEAAMRALDAMPPARRGHAALVGYDMPHVFMMAGVVAVAAGSRLSLPTLTEPTTLAAATLLGGGAAVYLCALGLFRQVLGFAASLPRVVSAGLVLALIPVGDQFGAAQQLGATAALIFVTLLAEHLAHARRGSRDAIRQDVRHD